MLGCAERFTITARHALDLADGETGWDRAAVMRAAKNFATEDDALRPDGTFFEGLDRPRKRTHHPDFIPLIGFEYWTDAYVVYPGFSVDAIVVGTEPLDGAETPGTLNLQGFEITDGIEISEHFNAYIAANRRHAGYDKSLKTAYNFGFLDFNQPDYGIKPFTAMLGTLKVKPKLRVRVSVAAAELPDDPFEA